MQSGSKESTHVYRPRLPVEIWLEILELVDRKRTLLALCHTSRMLRALACSFFKTLDLLPRETRNLSRQEQFQELKVIGAFRQPGLASTVTRFDVQLVSSPGVCQWGSRRFCACWSLEMCVVEVLDAMVNLEHLSIHCVLCSSPERSRYLNSLQPRKLRSLSYRCSCGTTSHNEPGPLLTAPILNTVEALRWAHGMQDRYPWWTTESFLNRTILPCITRLEHQGKSVENEILSTRPIQRVCVTSQPRLDGSFRRALYTFPGSLTHIVMEEFFKLDSIISKDPVCFVNVRHIGTIPAIPYGDKVRGSAGLISRQIKISVFRSSHT